MHTSFGMLALERTESMDGRACVSPVSKCERLCLAFRFAAACTNSDWVDGTRRSTGPDALRDENQKRGRQVEGSTLPSDFWDGAFTHGPQRFNAFTPPLIVIDAAHILRLTSVLFCKQHRERALSSHSSSLRSFTRDPICDASLFHKLIAFRKLSGCGAA